MDPTKVHSVKIFPPIGVARLGDSGFDLDKGVPDGDITYFIPSEIPGVEDAPAGGFRDSRNRIKRQAARFRVYAYDNAGTNLGEITHANNYELTWTVHVANAKGSFHVFRGIHKSVPKPEPLRNPDVQPELGFDERTKLIVDPGEKRISGTTAAPVDLVGKFHGSRLTGVDVGLGQLRTEARLGHLIFVPAPGYSRSVADPKKPHFQPDIINEFDSIDWVDDTCDGWVDVKVKFVGTPPKKWLAEEKATIITAPPKFSWGINAPTSLYDLIENFYWKEEGWKTNRETEFYQDIWPVLSGSYALSWVNKLSAAGHGPMAQGNFLPFKAKLEAPPQGSSNDPYKDLREFIFKRLRKPNYQDPTQVKTTFMPRLSGNSGDAIEPGNPVPARYRGPVIERFAALTELQYERFKEWHKGNFSKDAAPWERYNDFQQVPKELQPLFLTRAALEHTSGEPIYPGIEVYWVVKEKNTYKISSVPHRGQDPPFRINHNVIKPGHLGRGLSLPWQSDFDLCNTHWWPSIRPDDVLREEDWKKGSTEKKISEDDFITKIDRKQIKWSRNLRVTPEHPTEFYPGSTDMVRHWRKLGFVSKHKDYAVKKETLEMPVWLEVEALKRLPLEEGLENFYF